MILRKGGAMVDFVTDNVNMLFGPGLKDDVVTQMGELWIALLKIFNESGFVSSVLTIFVGIACSLLVLYFGMDIYNQVSRDMFSFEKLIVMLLKLVMAFAILLCLQDIITTIINIGYNMYKLCGDSSFSSTIFGSVNDAATVKVDLSDTAALKKEFSGLNFVFHIGIVGVLFLASLIFAAIKLLSMFVCISNAVMIVARAVFAPIAVVQVFDEGTRSAGIRYIKKFVAECCTMAGICVILTVVPLITNSLTAVNLPVETITAANLDQVITFGTFGTILIPQLVLAGGLATGSKLIHDVVGVQ